MEGINFGSVDKIQVEFELDEQFRSEATRTESEWGEEQYFQTKTLNIQNFNIEQFSDINFIDNINPIVDHIQQTISDDIDGIKFKNSHGIEFIVTIFHNDEKYGAKKIGQGGFGTVSMTTEIKGKGSRGYVILKSFAIKKIQNPTKDAIKEIAYNIFKTNKQSSKTDTILNQKSSFIGSILRNDAFFIIMENIEVSLRNLIDTCKQKNLMMVVDEDVLKFLILEMFQQLKILRETGASHGDVKPENIMFSYEADRNTIKLDSADVQLIDYGCTGPDNISYGASPGYIPLDNWRGDINDQNSTISTYKSIQSEFQTIDSETCKKDLHPRKHGSKFDSWSSFITLLEFLNFSHPFQHALNSGNYLNELKNFKFNKKMLHFSNTYSSELIELFEKTLTIETKIIDGEEVPVRWGVEEVIASNFYKETQLHCARLRRKFYIFLKLVYDYETGLDDLLYNSEKINRKEVIKIYSNLQKSLFNNSFTDFNSPVIDNCLRRALWNEEYYSRSYFFNDYFSTKQSQINLPNFDFSKRSENSMITEKNLVADKEKVGKMLNYYGVYRKILYPEFYVDDEILVDEFQVHCIGILSKKTDNFTEILKFNDNFKLLGMSSKSEVDFALWKFKKWKDHREKQMSLIRAIKYSPPFDCLLTFNSNKLTTQNLNTATFNQLFNSAIASTHREWS